jgi:hypothetical protein
MTARILSAVSRKTALLTAMDETETARKLNRSFWEI